MKLEERRDAALEAARDGRWEDAIAHAKRVPWNWDVWQQFPHIPPKGIPEHAVHQILDVLQRHGNHWATSGFISNMVDHLHPNHSMDLLSRLWIMAKDDGRARHDLENHSKWRFDHPHHPAGTFWHDYERKVRASHFATIEAWMKGKDVKLKDHRGNTGTSDEFIHLIPEFESYAKAAQRAIADDPHFPKRKVGKKTYIQVHRGIGGKYGEAIRNALNYDEANHTADLDKKLVVPTAIFTSWTRDKEMAQRFANGRDATVPGNTAKGGIVISKWVPLDDVLHSGAHDIYPGHQKAHPEELEVVVRHPRKTMRIKGSDVSIRNKTHPQEFYSTPGATPPAQLEESDSKLEKAKVKDYFLRLGTAASMLGYSVPTATMEHVPKAAAHFEQKQHAEPHPDLEAIAMIESTGNKNVAHKPVKHGLNAGTSAIGMYGLMPIQVQDSIKHDPQLTAKYGDLLAIDPVADQEKISALLLGNEHLQHEIANSHWKRLRNRFAGNSDRMAYAWLNGITGALRATDEEVQQHPYVKKFNNYKKLIELEDKQDEKLGKSEQGVGDKVKDIVAFLPSNPADDRFARHITEMIRDGQVHDLSNTGHFTHSSFVVGLEDDDSWLIKIESTSRPAIQSAKYGLQTVKEAAFYEAAMKVFGLQEYVPQAIPGEIARRIPNSDRNQFEPAVAIKLMPKNFKLAADMNDEKPGSMVGVLEPYRKSGLLHKMAAMYMVLGEADAHGRNLMTDGTRIALIDHGTSFADHSFDPAQDDKVFIPYFLRAQKVTDAMSKETKLSLLPHVESDQVRQDLKTYVLSISPEKIREVLSKYNIDPEPEIERLNHLKEDVMRLPADYAINRFWVYGKNE